MKNEDLLNLNPKKDNKKPLIYAAIGFLVFIILVIAVAIFQNLSNSKNEEILPPAPQENMTKDTEEFKPLPVEEANTKVVEENKTEEKAAANGQPQAEKTETTAKPAAEEQKSQSTEESKPAPAVQESAAPVIQTPKTVEKPKAVEKPKTTAAKTSATPKVSKNGKYYIQVAALLRNAKPNKKFLSLLEKYGYNYKTLTTYINKNGEKIKVTKLLVGPYATKAEAKKVLYKIKRDVTQNAFIYYKAK